MIRARQRAGFKTPRPHVRSFNDWVAISSSSHGTAAARIVDSRRGALAGVQALGTDDGPTPARWTSWRTSAIDVTGFALHGPGYWAYAARQPPHFAQGGDITGWHIYSLTGVPTNSFKVDGNEIPHRAHHGRARGVGV